MKQAARALVQHTLPTLWLRWHFWQTRESAEPELILLDRVVHFDRASVDIGANFGLYTRQLARLSHRVHAFEPSPPVAKILKRTSADNVIVHQIALSDDAGVASLRIPSFGGEKGYGLASIEPQNQTASRDIETLSVQTDRLDSVIHSDVGFIKIDVEGHELSVLSGATRIIADYQPIFLVEAENRHRADATRSVFGFFGARNYSGFFVKGGEVLGIEEFDADRLQDQDALTPEGGRKKDRFYINNFFFFPERFDGRKALQEGLVTSVSA